MRALSPDLADALCGDALRLVTAWRIRRRDGQVLGFTDCDMPLAFDGTLFAPSTASGRGAHELGLDVDAARFIGALVSDGLSPDELDAGHFDGAQIEAWRVDWSKPAARMRILVGAFGAVRRTGSAFEVEVRDAKAALDHPVGRIYARSCDADLGDARCGVDLTDARFAGASCDKSFATCRSTFSNAVNFRGFPHMLGPDGLIRGPVDGEVTDGGARR